MSRWRILSNEAFAEGLGDGLRFRVDLQLLLVNAVYAD
jgi:hypothetical protein